LALGTKAQVMAKSAREWFALVVLPEILATPSAAWGRKRCFAIGPSIYGIGGLRRLPRAPEGGSVMVQPGRQEHQLAAQRETPPSRLARYKALAWARDQFEGSLAQSFLQRLKVLDFAKQAVLFGSGLLVSLLPLVILLSAFASSESMMTFPTAWAWTAGRRASWTTCSPPPRPR
jgi:hypothetical protein